MKDKLGTRIKDQYESRTKYKLMRRCPTIIRLDGKAFHTYCKNLTKPFDMGLIEDMQFTAKFLCKEIQGAKCAYVQSDEISILLTDYNQLTTSAWFDNSVQKICSVSASLATSKFNQLRTRRNILIEIPNAELKIDLDRTINHNLNVGDVGRKKSLGIKHMLSAFNSVKIANFDSRVFQIADHEEVVNYFVWRYFDAVRNSKSMLAQSLYSPSQLKGKNTTVQQQMALEKGIDWEALPFSCKSGSFIIKDGIDWVIKEAPIFSKERNVILDLLKIPEEDQNEK